jgi:hypothetical protein
MKRRVKPHCKKEFTADRHGRLLGPVDRDA